MLVFLLQLIATALTGWLSQRAWASVFPFSLCEQQAADTGSHQPHELMCFGFVHESQHTGGKKYFQTSCIDQSVKDLHEAPTSGKMFLAMWILAYVTPRCTSDVKSSIKGLAKWLQPSGVLWFPVGTAWTPILHSWRWCGVPGCVSAKVMLSLNTTLPHG